MNNVIQLEDRVSRSRSKHEGESSAEICDRLSRTRVSSQRQLPTDPLLLCDSCGTTSADRHPGCTPSLQTAWGLQR